MKQLFSLTATLLLSGLLQTASAVEEHLISPDHPKADDISLDPGETFVGFFHAGRSYECRVSQVQQVGGSDDYLYFTGAVTGPSGGFTATFVGNLYPAEATMEVTLPKRNQRRIALVPSATGQHTFGMQFDANLGATGTVECYETTLTGGFNSFFAAVPIVELRNKGNQAVTVSVTATDFNGAIVDTETISVPAGSRADAILTVPSQRYGKILATYLAPRDSIEGIVAEYDFAGGGQITLKRERPMTLTPIVP